MRCIYYIGFYDLDIFQDENRNYCLAATNKMDYICEVIGESGYNVQIVSPSGSQNLNRALYPGRTTKINSQKSVTLGPTFGASHKLMKACRLIFSLVWLTLWLIRHTKKSEKVLLYHSPFLCIPVLLAKKVRGFQIILELEEVYSNVWKLHKHWRKYEYQLIRNSHSFIFPSYLLYDRLCKEGIIRDVDRCFVHGDYRLSLSHEKQQNHDIYHILFAGSIEKTRNGAFNAVDCCKYLSDKYRMHILGYGSHEIVEELNTLIETTNRELGFPMCVFYGGKKGREYDKFLSRCDIALNPQDQDDMRMDYAFPSKVISYLAHGLRVVSTRLECITQSDVADLVCFTKECSAKGFADAIMSIDFNEKYDASTRIETLNSKLLSEIKRLLS